jgi:transcriptional regulator GlxA family with amidase domain
MGSGSLIALMDNAEYRDVIKHHFETAPKPQVIVIPARGGRSDAQKAWLLSNSATADVTMSVCPGASMLAKYGLLDGLTATTHHMYAASMQKQYPAAHFVSGTRFVENGKVAHGRRTDLRH